MKLAIIGAAGVALVGFVFLSRRGSFAAMPGNNGATPQTVAPQVIYAAPPVQPAVSYVPGASPVLQQATQYLQLGTGLLGAAKQLGLFGDDDNWN